MVSERVEIEQINENFQQKKSGMQTSEHQNTQKMFGDTHKKHHNLICAVGFCAIFHTNCLVATAAVVILSRDRECTYVWWLHVRVSVCACVCAVCGVRVLRVCGFRRCACVKVRVCILYCYFLASCLSLVNSAKASLSQHFVPKARSHQYWVVWVTWLYLFISTSSGEINQRDSIFSFSSKSFAAIIVEWKGSEARFNSTKGFVLLFFFVRRVARTTSTNEW